MAHILIVEKAQYFANKLLQQISRFKISDRLLARKSNELSQNTNQLKIKPLNMQNSFFYFM